MSDVVTFYTNPMSRGRLVHWMLEECGAQYDTRILSFDKREHKAPEFLKINPMGKVPTIVHKGVTVTEVPAILAYLADAYPAAKLAPATNDPQRGSYYRWLFFGMVAEQAIMDKHLGRESKENSGRLAYGTVEDTLATLEKAVTGKGPYLLGEQFTAADVYIASQLGFGMFMLKTIEPRPAFTAYLGRCTDRPAHKRFMELSPLKPFPNA